MDNGEWEHVWQPLSVGITAHGSWSHSLPPIPRAAATIGEHSAAATTALHFGAVCIPAYRGALVTSTAREGLVVGVGAHAHELAHAERTHKEDAQGICTQDTRQRSESDCRQVFLSTRQTATHMPERSAV